MAYIKIIVEKFSKYINMTKKGNILSVVEAIKPSNEYFLSLCE